MDKIIEKLRAELQKIKQFTLPKVKNPMKSSLNAGQLIEGLKNVTEKQRNEIYNALEIYARVALNQINRLNILKTKKHGKPNRISTVYPKK